MPIDRDQIIAEARDWLGTPYHHQASVKGVGCDCLGLVRGVWLALVGIECETPPAYSRDWAEASGSETLLDAASRHLTPKAALDLQPGDIVVFRVRSAMPAKHIGILVTPGTFVHAMEGGGACEVALSPWWRRRIAGVFSFSPCTI
jgi:NlpC/P60 family putative phage cell wall peptidase